MKKCYFDEESSDIYKLLKDFSEDDFIDFSKDITKRLYDIMNSNLAIPSADLAVLSFSLHSVMYLAILKMNYKDLLNKDIIITNIPLDARGIFIKTFRSGYNKPWRLYGQYNREKI